jgi:hypothetical protein
MNDARKFASTVRFWLLYGVLSGVIGGAGLYLLTTDDFTLKGLIGYVLGLVVTMVIVGQFVRLLAGSDDRRT